MWADRSCDEGHPASRGDAATGTVWGVTGAATTSTRGDLIAAYAATGAKVLSWVVAAAVVYRTLGEAAFAVLAMTRATLGLLNYTTFGLGPALTRLVAEREAALLDVEPVQQPVQHDITSMSALDYFPANRPSRPVPPARVTTLRPSDPRSPASLLSTAGKLLLALFVIAFPLLSLYANHFDIIHNVPREVTGLAPFVFLLAAGMATRLAGDALGGVTQGMGRVSPDQVLAAFAELLWPALLFAIVLGEPSMLTIQWVAGTYAISGTVGMLLRYQRAKDAVGWDRNVRPRPSFAQTRLLLLTGGLVTLGNAADFLYAPIDYLILNRLVDPLSPAVYAPSIQVDAAILIFTTAVATVALPSAARLHAKGDLGGVWRSYVRGSLLAGGVAMGASAVAWAVSPWAFELWLGDDLPATRAILPWVLLHTILGSAAGVGRATLIAVGRPGLYAGIVLVAGLVNAGISVGLVHFGWGIRGVIAGTVISVALRCLIALPWAIARATRSAQT